MIFFHDFQANFAKVKNRKFHHFFPSKSLPRYLLQKPQICKNVQFSTFQAQNMNFGVELHQITSGEAQTTSREQPHQISWQADKQKILFLDFRHPPYVTARSGRALFTCAFFLHFRLLTRVFKWEQDFESFPANSKVDLIPNFFLPSCWAVLEDDCEIGRGSHNKRLPELTDFENRTFHFAGSPKEFGLARTGFKIMKKNAKKVGSKNCVLCYSLQMCSYSCVCGGCAL